MPLEEKIKPNVVLLFGPPGAGKTTIGRMLEDDHMRYISVGECKRRHIREGTQLGKRIARRKQRLSGNLVMKIVEYEMRRLEEEGSYDPRSHTMLIDGAPRYLEQMKVFDRHMEVGGILFFSMGIEAAKERARKRVSRERGYDAKVFEGKIKRLLESTIPVVVQYSLREIPISIIDAQMPIAQVYRDARMALEYGDGRK